MSLNADAILKDTAVPVEMGRLDIAINASIGIAVYPENGTSRQVLINNADAAMYHTKELTSGRAFFRKGWPGRPQWKSVSTRRTYQ